MAGSLYIVDGHWLVYRAYYAPFRDLTSPAGEPTRATYVFISMLLKLIVERRPEYLALALDSPRETLRRTRLYRQYKAQRAEAPEDLPPQVERIVQIVRAMGVPILQQQGAEADDIMATLARRLAGPELRVVLVSRDKDLEQLIGPHVVLYDPTKDEEIDAERLKQLKGYSPSQAVEVQALCGDAADNIPGVPGVGPKTAVKLLTAYDTLDNVYAHLDELKPGLRKNLLAAAEAVALSRELVKLDDQVPIEVRLEDLAFSGVRAEAVRPIFAELGFRRLAEPLEAAAAATAPGGQAVPGSVKSAPPAVVAAGRTTAAQFDYRCIDTPEDFRALLGELKGLRRLAIDTETTSSQPMWAELVGISLAWRAGHGVYLPLAAPLGQRTLDRRMVVEALGPILADGRVEKVGHNLKYDAIVLSAADMPLAPPMFDTMLAAYVLEASRGSFKLDDLAAEYLNHQCIPIEEVLGKGRSRRRMDEVPVEQVSVYAAEDAEVALRLADVLRDRLEAEGLTELYEKVELALMPVLVAMEVNGIRVDRQVLERQKGVLAERAGELRARIVSAAGCDFNPDSPRQLAEVLFDRLKLPVLRRGKTAPSTNQAVLAELAPFHEVPALVLEYRQITKLLSTYLEALGRCIHPRTGRVHTSFHQTGTATGRLSSSDPNLQNIPIRTELGRQIRAAFVAGPGNVLISADYSQIELRVLAHFCQDPTLMAAFHADQDIHRIVAAEVFGVPPEQVSPQQRARAKTVNFGIIYGQTAFGLARTLGISRTEAGEFIRSYKARFPRIEQFLAECVAQARSRGYVETLAGRRRRIEGFDSANPQRRALAERLAINTVVQGSAADLIKIAMINLHRRLARERRPARMLLQIHDELLFETPAEAADADAAIIRQEMTQAMELRVPLKVDIGIGPNWRDVK